MRVATGGLIALILLGLYVYAVWIAILVVDCAATPGCVRYPLGSFSDGMVQALTLVGGLVSALVIAELALTKPGEQPMARALSAKLSPRTHKTVRWITMVYLLVWIVAGLCAYVVGQILHPKVLQPLTDLGQSWLGLAVAAGYSYFGISPASR